MTDIERLQNELDRIGVDDLFEVRDHSDDGRYIMLGSGDETWCHDVAALLAVLQDMEDDQYAGVSDDLEETAQRNSDFCQATGKAAGYSAEPPAGTSWSVKDAWWAGRY